MPRNISLALFVAASLLLGIGCASKQGDGDIPVTACKNITGHVSDIDSLSIDNIDMGWACNLYMIDTCLVVSDNQQCQLFLYDLRNGNFIDKRLGKGHGPKEIPTMLESHPIQNGSGEIIILDASAGFYMYDLSRDTISSRRILDFNHANEARNDYDALSNYTLMNMSDFAMSFFKLDSAIIAPVSIISRNFDNIDSDRYKNGHIFTLIDGETGKVSALKGKFPAYYSNNALPFFEFFDYAVDDDSGMIYYSFAPDSLIYTADLQCRPVKAFGLEPAGVNRQYTTGFTSGTDEFVNDIATVGVNTGIYFDKDARLIFRTSMQDFESGNIVLQIYDTDGCLRAEELMPRYFKMLGKLGDRYYGVRFVPVETDNDSLIYRLYSFTVDV